MDRASGEANGNWKGGRTITPDGYVLVRVGRGHHLADVRGYAYEHRVVAEAEIGRRLTPDEEVHHRDHDRANNSPRNLKVTNRPEHRVEHRQSGSRLKLPSQPNVAVECACGCGNQFMKFDRQGRPRSYVSGHNGQRDPKTGRMLSGR